MGGLLARPVEHDADRALVLVLEQQDDGAEEVRVEQVRRRDQELTGERLGGRLLGAHRRAALRATRERTTTEAATWAESEMRGVGRRLWSRGKRCVG